MDTITKFEVGRTYATRSICDHECIFRAKVVARTAKRLTVEMGGKLKVRGITVWDNVETFAPFGRYSMSPTIRASKPE